MRKSILVLVMSGEMKCFFRGLDRTANRLGGSLLLCFLIILCRIGVSQAMFLSPGDAKSAPRGRVGCRPCSRIGIRFLNPERLGPHGYSYAWSEKNGIVYACRAGFLDIAHVRGAIDRTAFLATKTFHKLQKQETEFSFKLAEPSLYFVKLVPPDNWNYLPQKEKEDIARDISIRLGQYFAHTACIWHEILTWFGYKSVGFFPEFHSAFSCEDTFSDLIGSHIGAMALQDTEHEFDQAAALALDRELKKLGAQTRRTAIRATKMVSGQWFSGGLLFVQTKRRNFDIGLEDGSVTPWIVPAVSGFRVTEAQSYPAPNSDFLSEYGFSLKFELEPREWEKDKIMKIVYPDARERRRRIEPIIHFTQIMDYIKKDAVRRYGYYAGSPSQETVAEDATDAAALALFPN
ncbi:DUF4056 domain-containing protein [Planctomycetota bacterium]